MQQEKNSLLQSDPTLLTTQQLLREVSALKELVFTRLEAIDTSIRVSHEDLVRVPTDVQKQVAALKELMEARIDGSDRLKEEKFRNIDKRLDLVEQARIEQKKDTATAVDAALKAAKEAVTEQNTSNVLAINKSETATTKQIDQQGVLIAQIIKNFDEKINDLKNKQVSTEGQIAALESMKGQVGVLMSGSSESKGKSAGIALVISLIVSAVAIIGLIIKYAGN
jgi:hypothetical protein